MNAKDFGLDGGQTRYKGKHLPLDAINILAQPRKTFEDIDFLAMDLADKGILNPPTVARFSRKYCAQYIKTSNSLWGTNFQIENLHSRQESSQNIFYVLLAGERRLRSCRLLWEKGCDDCNEKYGQEAPGTCFRRHFGNEKIEVRLCHNIPPLQALFLQLSENTHMAVPLDEEARAYYLLFNLLKQTNASVSVGWFARKVGRSPHKIRGALRFCELPSSIQESVGNALIPYGVALELGRLQENGEKDLNWWMMRAVVEKKTVPEFRDTVNQHLQEKKSGQVALFDIMNSDIQKKFVRKTVEANTIKAIWSWIYYFGKVLHLFEDGLLGLSDSPFSQASPLKVFRTHIDQLNRLLPHLKRVISKKRYEYAKSVLGEVTDQIAES